MELSFKSFFFREQAAATREKNSHNLACGSGTIISPEGAVLTANHVVENAPEIFIINGFEIFPAKLVKSLPESDIAILKILESERNFEFCSLSEKPRYPLGLQVFNISFPDVKSQGFDAKLTKSYIACEEAPFSKNCFQIDAEISPGSSGSAIFDRSGEIIGVVSCRLFDEKDSDNFPRNVTYVVKSDSFGKAIRPYLPRRSSPSAGGFIDATAASVMVFSSPSNR